MVERDDGQTPRIAWVIKGLGLGGAERIVADVVPRLCRRGLDITVLSTLNDMELAPLLEAAGVEVRTTSSDRLWPVWLANELRSGSFDIVHTHSPLAASWVSGVGPILRRLTDWPRLTVDTAHTDVGAYNRWTRLANAATAGLRDAVVATSEISRLGVEGETVVHHGVPASVNSEVRKPGECLRLISVARFRPQKDQESLIKACALLRDDGIAFTLDLVGDGPLRDQLERLVASLALGDRVRFLGWRQDVRDILPGYDVFVLSTHAEGFPIALVEAIVCGLRCVGSDVPGVREVLTLNEGGLCGSLSVPSDPASLAAAIRTEAEAVLNESDRLHLRRRASELDVESTVQAYVALYDSLLAEHG